MTTVRVLAEGLQFPEGPAFDAGGDLWCTELGAGALARLTDAGLERHPVGGVPNSMLFTAGGDAIVCDAERDMVARYDPATREWTPLAERIDGEPLRGPNDLAFDAAGNLVFTCPRDSGEEAVGYVCCLRPDGSVHTVGEGMRFPNGLAFVEEGSALIVAESHRQRLWKGAWDAGEGRWIDPQPWAEFGGEAGPDGIALGEDGLLYVALFGSSHVVAAGPDGRVEERYEIPGGDPTNCAFDPSGRLGLVVTETRNGTLLSLPDLGPGVPLYAGWSSRGLGSDGR